MIGIPEIERRVLRIWILQKERRYPLGFAQMDEFAIWRNMERLQNAN